MLRALITMDTILHTLGSVPRVAGKINCLQPIFFNFFLLPVGQRQLGTSLYPGRNTPAFLDQGIR